MTALIAIFRKQMSLRCPLLLLLWCLTCHCEPALGRPCMDAKGLCTENKHAETGNLVKGTAGNSISDWYAPTIWGG